MKTSRLDSGAPTYLLDEQMLHEELLKEYDLGNPEDAKAEARLAKLRELEIEQKKKQPSDSRTLAEISAATAKQKRL